MSNKNYKLVIFTILVVLAKDCSENEVRDVPNPLPQIKRPSQCGIYCNDIHIDLVWLTGISSSFLFAESNERIVQPCQCRGST